MPRLHFSQSTSSVSLLFSSVISFALLAACSNEVAVPTPVAIMTTAPEAAAAQSIIPTPLPPLDEATINATPESSPLQKEVEAAFAADQGIQISSEGTSGLNGVSAFETASPVDGDPIWIAYTTGIRSFDPLQNHAVAVYKKNNDTWSQLALLEMVDNPAADANAQPAEATQAQSEQPKSEQSLPAEAQPAQSQTVSPDFLGPGSVFPVTVSPDRLWLQVDGGTGAHSGVFALLSFDGTTLKEEASAFSSSPGAGSVEDVNGDGIGEVILNNTDYYIFCYACGVRAPSFSILRWDGTAMVAVEPQPLAADAPADMRALNDRMLEQANAGLWKDALATMDEMISLNPQAAAGDIAQWNIAWVRVNGEARRVQAESQGGAYLLLDQVFYGDFATAVDAVRGYEPESIFNFNSPLIIGTVAEGNQEALSNAILTSVAGAIKLYPADAATAPAYFLQSWAYFLQGKNAEALSAMEQASTLAPDDKLYQDSLLLLKK